MVQQQPIAKIVAGSLLLASLAGCGTPPNTLTVTAMSAETGSPSPAGVAPRPLGAPSRTAAATWSASPTSTVSPTPDPPLTSEQIAGLAPGWVTMAGAPNSNNPAAALTPGDPVNVIVVGSAAQLDDTLVKAGWVHPAPVTFGSVIQMGWSLVSHMPDPTAPVSNLYLFDRKQDMAWETNSADVDHRDHCRGWQSSLTDGDGQSVWLISGSHDVGIKWDAAQRTTTHKISPDIDSERDLIVQALEGAATLKRVYRIAGIGDGKPYAGKNGGGDPYQTDGMAVVLEF